MKPSESLFLDIRGLRYHVRSWGNEGAPKLFFLHGWMDVSASFQFVVDALSANWHVLAPDWRGYGLTAWTCADSYWYPDYFADLDRLLGHFQPDEPVNLVGHSMGGNVSCIFAGVRPQKIRRLVILEGFSIRDNAPEEAPGRYSKWLDQLRETQRLRDYASFEELAQRLRARNPRLGEPQSLFLARHWGRARDDGRIELRSDPLHKIVNPTLYRAQEVMACLRNIVAPVLWVQGEESDLSRRLKIPEDEMGRRKSCVRHLTEVLIPGAGHMLHHDQPERVAAAIESFVLQSGLRSGA